MSNTVLAKHLDPGDDDRGTPDHRVEGSTGLLLAGSRDLFDQKFEIDVDRTEIDVLWIPWWHGWVVIVWHTIDRARIRVYGRLR